MRCLIVRQLIAIDSREDLTEAVSNKYILDSQDDKMKTLFFCLGEVLQGNGPPELMAHQLSPDELLKSQNDLKDVLSEARKCLGVGA